MDLEFREVTLEENNWISSLRTVRPYKERKIFLKIGKLPNQLWAIKCQGSDNNDGDDVCFRQNPYVKTLFSNRLKERRALSNVTTKNLYDKIPPL